jgi:hypothetical protein
VRGKRGGRGAAAAPPASRPRASWLRSSTTPERPGPSADCAGEAGRHRCRAGPDPQSGRGGRRQPSRPAGERGADGRPRAEPAQPRRHSWCGAPVERERSRGCGGAEGPGVAGVQPVRDADPGFRRGFRRGVRAERRASRSGAG